MSRSSSFLRIGIAYLVSAAVALIWLLAGPDTGRIWLDTLLADLLATVAIFAFSRLYRNSSVYDAYWSVVPPVLLVWWWAAGDLGVGNLRCWLALFLVGFWAARLTYNWARSFPGLHHEDWRYPLVRARAGRQEVLADLVAIHLLPTLQVFLGMLPIYVTVTHRGSDLTWLTWIAWVLGLSAVVLEIVADSQLHRFLRDRTPGQVMDRGLWGWSRHPNYFGEFVFWVALALFGIATVPASAWWLWIGPAAMLAMFLGASIPMMEQRSLDSRPGYQEVVARVPRFVPRAPRRVPR